MKPITLHQATSLILQGGFIRMMWKTVKRFVVIPDGSTYPLHGSTFKAIYKSESLSRTETGDTEVGDLIMEWRSIQ